MAAKLASGEAGARSVCMTGPPRDQGPPCYGLDSIFTNGRSVDYVEMFHDIQEVDHIH